MTPEEFERVRRLMAAIARTRPRRQSRRRTPDTEAIGSTCVACAESRCAPAASRSSSRGSRARWCTASSSCSATSQGRWTPTRGRLFYLHAIVGSGSGVEAFAFGTRLTRLTPDLATRDPEAALARANEIAVDWGSGTRIGGSLAEFNAIYGRRALSRGAVVVIVSTAGSATTRTSSPARWRSSRGRPTRSFGSTR